MGYDMGTRQRCENCKHGAVDRNGRGLPIKAYCLQLKMAVPEKRFKEISSCLWFEKEE